MLQGDELTLSVAAGQDSSTFTLISDGDADDNATLTLAASVNGTDADPAADPARLTVNFKAVVEADPPSDTATYTGTAEGEVIWAGVDADDEGMVHHTAQAIVNGGDGNDFLSDGSGQDETDGGAGNDLIVITGIDSAAYPDLAGQAEHIVGGAGNDLISLADTMADIDAGSGDDIVIGQGLFEVLSSRQLEGGSSVFIQLWPLLAARFDPRILTTAEAGMAVDAQDNATPQLRALEQDFSGTLDSATTFPTSFHNITYNAGTTYAYSAADHEITITPAGPDGVLDASAQTTWTVGLHYAGLASEKPLTIDGGAGNDALVGNGGADDVNAEPKLHLFGRYENDATSAITRFSFSSELPSLRRLIRPEVSGF